MNKYYLIDANTNLAVWVSKSDPILTENSVICDDETFLCFNVNTVYTFLRAEVPNFHPNKYRKVGANLIIDSGWVEPTIDLTPMKLAKNAQINDWRLLANATSFTYLGKQIAVDITSKFDILFADIEIRNTSAMPTVWPGGWKTMDNSFVLISDVPTWKAFLHALYNQGAVNFGHAQELKGEVALATTVEAINAIVW